MSTTITGVHFVYRPANALERSQALADVALIQRERQIQITGIEYADGRFDPFDDEPAPPPDDFAVKLRYNAQARVWETTLLNRDGWTEATFPHQANAIAEILHHMLIAGGGDWIAVNRSTGIVT